MTYLLDVNALIALIWTDHASHTKAEKWIAGKRLATCPFSELGFLRISTNSKALGASMADARKLRQISSLGIGSRSCRQICLH